MTDNFGAGPTSGASGNVRDQVSVPAILLMVVGGLTVAAALYGAVQYLSGANEAQMAEALNNPQVPEQMKSFMQIMSKMGIFGSLIQLVCGGLSLFGGLKMKSLGSYGLSMAGAIAALIPCFGSCCCIGIPVGIWALIVLNKPEVKSAFPQG